MWYTAKKAEYTAKTLVYDGVQRVKAGYTRLQMRGTRQKHGYTVGYSAKSGVHGKNTGCTA